MSSGLIGDADVAVDRPALLREPRHIDDADALAFKMRGHAEDSADGDNAGAADAGYDDAVGMIDQRHRRRRQSRPVIRFGRPLACLQPRPVHGDKRRAEPVQAGVILVAARLVDGALAAPFGLQRLHRNAIRFHAAVTAALAHQIIDDDALFGIRERAALAAAALLGSAGLVVNQHAHARDGRQLPLNGVELVAVMNGQAARPFDITWRISTARRSRRPPASPLRRRLARRSAAPSARHRSPGRRSSRRRR